MISEIEIWKEAKTALFNKDPEKTIQLLSSFAQNTLHPNLCVDLAKAYLQLKQYDHAKIFTLKALSIEPDLYEGHRLLADLLYYKQAYKEALTHYKKLLFLMPQDKSALTRCAYCLCQLKQFNEALVYFEMCLKGFDLSINTMPGAWHLNYGMALLYEQHIPLALEHLTQAAQSILDDPHLYFHLGLSLQHLNRMEEASFYYNKALIIQPSHEGALYNNGLLMMQKGNHPKAIQHFEEILEIHPEHTHARVLLTSLKSEHLARLPDFFIQTLFDQYAHHYDDHLKNSLEYKTPIIMRNYLSQTFGSNLKVGSLIDLGCGTGLAGLAFRDVADKLIGIDISEGMLWKAKQKNIYEKLITGSILEKLPNLYEEVTYILALELFNYVGKDIEQLFHLIDAKLESGGIFAFTTEISKDVDVLLTSHARFAFTEKYLIALIEQHRSWKIKLITQAPLRRQGEDMINGFYFIIQKEHTDY